MKWTGRFEGYNVSSFQKDLLSGLIVGIIAIPLGMAFAIASGVKPEYGLYTTIIAGIIISLCGGSKFQIGGPTGAFIPILFAIVLQYGYENLLIAGLMSGVILVLMGLLRLGALIKFIPRPVTIGFTSGIAVIIFSGQIANFLGLQNIEKHENFWPNMVEIAAHISTVNLYSVLTAVICCVVIFVAQKYTPKIPGALAGLLASTMIATFLFEGNVDTIGSSFGAISSTLPQLHIPELTLEKIQLLIGPALVIAMLGGIESLLSAIVADGMTGSRHNSNRELVGQGLANIVTPLFGGIPATGAIARTATNIKSGAVSPISGVVHGVVVLLVLLAFARFASLIPLASMAPILMLVAWNMSERKAFLQLLKTKTSDSVVLCTTFILTVFTNLTIAVEVGLVLAVLLFLKRMSEALRVAKVLPDPSSKHEKVKAHMVTENRNCPQISLYTIEGPLFFGTAGGFGRSIMDTMQQPPKVLMLRMGKVPLIDTSGEAKLAELVRFIKESGGNVLVTGIQRQTLEVLKKSGTYLSIGEQNFFDHTGEAIDNALNRIDEKKCFGCKHYAFHECRALSRGSNNMTCSSPAGIANKPAAAVEG